MHAYGHSCEISKFWVWKSWKKNTPGLRHLPHCAFHIPFLYGYFHVLRQADSRSWQYIYQKTLLVTWRERAWCSECLVCNVDQIFCRFHDSGRLMLIEYCFQLQTMWDITTPRIYRIRIDVYFFVNSQTFNSGTICQLSIWNVREQYQFSVVFLSFPIDFP